MKRTFIMLAVSSYLLAAISGAVAQHTVVTDQELMDKLRDAAPAAVLKGAAILNMGADGQMKVIQAGTNGWTCMDPGGAPMCADESAMEWAKAWKSKGRAAKARLHLYAQRGQRRQQYRPVRHQREPGQQLDQNRLTRDDRRRRGQEHDAGLPEGRQARPDEALCDVAGNALRTLMLPVK